MRLLGQIRRVSLSTLTNLMLFGSCQVLLGLFPLLIPIMISWNQENSLGAIIHLFIFRQQSLLIQSTFILVSLLG